MSFQNTERPNRVRTYLQHDKNHNFFFFSFFGFLLLLYFYFFFFSTFVCFGMQPRVLFQYTNKICVRRLLRCFFSAFTCQVCEIVMELCLHQHTHTHAHIRTDNEHPFGNTCTNMWAMQYLYKREKLSDSSYTHHVDRIRQLFCRLKWAKKKNRLNDAISWMHTFRASIVHWRFFLELLYTNYGEKK